MDEDEMRRRQQQGNRRGLNENYARELLELHTVGVNGGYTQQDVTEVAKVFTGWTIRQPRMGGGFDFNDRMHEPASKRVLGRQIKEDGRDEGEQVLDMLARHPATARFISRKLAMRFVADDPPAEMVERMAQTFMKKDGEIREVLRTMLRSPEFWSDETYRAKVKTPFEFVVSAVRATSAEVDDALPLAQALNRMGMPLYAAQPPTGYSMKAEAWVNSAALVNRLNVALALGTGRLRGVKVDEQGMFAGRPPSDSEDALSGLEQALLAGDISKSTHETIRKQLSDARITRRMLDDTARPANTGAIAGLLLGSPEFQKR
jgi:uncharacterized protein (DUF1800 family)